MKYRLPHLIFEVTRECNLNCLYCYNYWKHSGNDAGNTSLVKVNRTIKKLLRDTDFSHITFTGGEPFTFKGLTEVVLTCRLKGKSVNLISNGTMAKEEDYRTLKMLGVGLIEFPLLSDIAETHDHMTSVKGSFDRVVNSIKSAMSAGLEICVVCVLTKINIKDLPGTLALAAKLGIRRFMLARFNIGGAGIANIDRLLLSKDDLRQAFSTADRYAADGRMSISSNVCVPLCIINPADYPNIPISSCGFDISRKPITVDYEGNVRICNHSPVIAGNIFKKSMADILSSDYIKSWQTTRPEFCADCKDWDKCGGGCRAASEQVGKTLVSEDPFVNGVGP